MFLFGSSVIFLSFTIRVPGWTEDDDDISINSTNNISPGEKVQSDKTAGQYIFEV